jgi:iron-sulfur cluster repair protein YtfE (RIC family)
MHLSRFDRRTTNVETQTQTTLTDDVAKQTIAQLVDRYPATMSILEPLGIDLCCGGAHPLGEALDLHGLDRATVLPQVVAIVAAAQQER